MPAAAAEHPGAFPKTHAAFSARLDAQEIILCSRIGSKQKSDLGNKGLLCCRVDVESENSVGLSAVQHAIPFLTILKLFQKPNNQHLFYRFNLLHLLRQLVEPLPNNSNTA